MNTEPNTIARLARQAVGLTTVEAGQLVHVSRRAWEMWESGERNIPIAKLELFMMKINGEHSTERELVVILGPGQIPIDVVANDTFLSISDPVEGEAVIKTMAIDRRGRPYVHLTRFCIYPYNAHVMEKVGKWRSALAEEMADQSERGTRPG
ncbi:MAG: helix-turn-helix domain-containing protein [Candidatus Methylumidiphilus sp.]